ncbi:MAG: VOC family protein [Alphaproteobacteria bacterium]|nr:VOC family protein [Alphaproteobacteria bacterium]
MSFIFDHIAIAADSLEQGVEFINQKFGVKIPFGGAHDQMGTHNHLMQIGDGIFLELIAINPTAQPPKAPQQRWFDLDSPNLQNQLKQSPKLVTWVARTANLKAEIQSLNQDIGKIHHVTRGNLTWQITIPKNGKLTENGLFPTLIGWQNNQTPAPNMANLGIKLTSFTLTHPEPKHLKALLKNHQPSKQFELIINKGEHNLATTFTNTQGTIIKL